MFAIMFLYKYVVCIIVYYVVCAYGQSVNNKKDK